MIKYMHSLEGIEDPVMADGTTAFSVALAKGRCDIIVEYMRFKRPRDMEIGAYAVQEPNINANVKKALLKSIKNYENCNLQLCLKPILDLTDFNLQLQPSRV